MRKENELNYRYVPVRTNTTVIDLYPHSHFYHFVFELTALYGENGMHSKHENIFAHHWYVNQTLFHQENFNAEYILKGKNFFL